MDVRPITEFRRTTNPLSKDAGLLIDTLGTPVFDTHLFRAVRAAVRCDHLTCFSVSKAGKPRVTLAMNSGGAPIARDTAEKYISRFWHTDLASRIPISGVSGDRGILVRITPDDIKNSSFRRECYSPTYWASSGQRILERISLIKRHKQELIRISFHRDRSVGPFESSDIERIISFSDILFPLMSKHGAIGTAPERLNSHEMYEGLLSQVASDLTGREIQVCARVALGMTSKVIASCLSIKPSSVSTYRKRAYSRLNISNQSDLSRLLFSAFAKEHGARARSDENFDQ
jgi:DNA-binding CsgD family transcriptional regulator